MQNFSMFAALLIFFDLLLIFIIQVMVTETEQGQLNKMCITNVDWNLNRVSVKAATSSLHGSALHKKPTCNW